MSQRRRCCAFDSPGLPNDSAGYPGLMFGVRGTTPSVLRFLSVIRHKSPRYTHVFTEKAQHLRRWISLRTLTRGRLVPHQPRAIKGTTRTELRNESIHHSGCIHGNICIFCYLFICMLALIVSKNARFNAVGVVLLIAQGCQTIVQATLGWHMLCRKQRRRCCAFSAQSDIKEFIISVSL